MEFAFKQCDNVMIERFLDGTEVTVGCYKTRDKSVVFPVTEVVTDNEFFDYDAKYNGQVDEITPARISDELTAALQAETSRIYDILHCNGIIRIDFIITKDPDGSDVPYFEEDFYDEEFFGMAMRVLDQQIAAHPDELRWYALKIPALCAYEKESPDMAVSELRTLIRRQASSKPSWTLDGEPADAEIFQQLVGEVCYNFFQTGSDTSYEYFKDISEQMNKLYPKNPVFLDNIGSYWQVARGNDKQAEKFYKKALKLDPGDYAATRNLQLIAKKKSQARK
jgi:tetratricopeptide (TPR) repeat protein